MILTGMAALLLTFSAAIMAALSIRLKRRIHLAVALLMTAAGYFTYQCSVLAVLRNAKTGPGRSVSAWFSAMPPAAAPLLTAVLLAGIVILYLSLRQYEKNRITPLSVKKAVDSLPSGLLVYVPGGRVLMVNRAMEAFCRRATGSLPINGEEVRERLAEGSLLSGCRRETAGSTPVILLPDGRAWSLSETEAPYGHLVIRRLLVSDVTENYRKTLELRKMHEKLTELNNRLTDYNREIVALTAEKELFSARVQVHDQMGEDLLTMKRYVTYGGDEEERRSIEAMVRRSITFLKNGPKSAGRDEYELILQTAEKLGIHITVSGCLPRTEPARHVTATALHECMTNTLRHAHGDRLRLSVTDTGSCLLAEFTNNGEQPKAPIRETGGLAALRRMAEQAGIRMDLSSDPAFSLILTIPKEVTVSHGIQGADRG